MADDGLTYVILFGSAFIAGVMNAIAGGGTLLTFPALVSALGPGGDAMANATSTVALLPGSVAGTWGYRQELAANRRLALQLLPVSLAGGLLGSLILVWFPQQFAMLVPWLILSAAVLFLVQPPITRFIRRKQDEDKSKDENPAVPVTLTSTLIVVAHKRSMRFGILAFQFLVSVYGGYFGAGIGILMLTALSFMRVGNIHSMNAIKTFLATAINGISVVIFLSGGLIRWRYAVVMAVAAIMGGYYGATVARRLPAYVVRWAVIVIGFGLAIFYAIRQYSTSSI